MLTPHIVDNALRGDRAADRCGIDSIAARIAAILANCDGYAWIGDTLLLVVRSWNDACDSRNTRV